MEEYMKKQAAKKDSPAVGSKVAQAKPGISDKKSLTASKDFSESSDRYTDEDFESMSKSASHFAGLPKTGPKKAKADASYGVAAAYNQPSQLMHTYAKKENRYAQTDRHYDPDQEGPSHTGVAREYTLQRHLQDAEHLIQMNKDQQADLKEETNEMEQKMKK